MRLRSKDPRDTPDIHFHYFDQGDDPNGEDLASVVNGVRFVRRMNAHNDGIAEEQPGRPGGVAPFGVGEPDGQLGEPAPELAFFVGSGLPRCFEDLVGVERVSGVQESLRLL